MNIMTSEEKIIGAVALGGLAIWFATRGTAKAHGGMEGSGATDPCTQLAALRAQYAAFSATGQPAAAAGLLPAIASLEAQCEPKQSGYAEKMKGIFGDRDDPTICLRWKTGNAKVPWGAPQFSKIESAVDRAITDHYRDFKSIADAEQIAFEVTRAALRDVCPRVPAPAVLEQVQEYKDDQDLGFWWDDLWNYFWQAAWKKVIEKGGGSL